MKRTYVKNRVLSYLLITLIPLLTSMAVYSVTFFALSSAIDKTEKSVFASFTKYFEASLKTAIEKTHKVVYGYDYISLDHVDLSLGADDDKFTSVKDKLTAIKTETPYIAKVAIPVSGKNYITDTGLYNETYFTDTIAQLVGKSAEDLEILYDDCVADKIFLSDFGQYSAAIVKVDFVTGKKAIWIIDNARLKETVDGYFSYKNFDLTVGDIKISNGTMSGKARGNKIIGESTGIGYALFVSQSEYSDIFVPLWSFFCISVLASVFLTAFLIMKNVKKGYKPIENLEKKLNGSSGEALPTGDFSSIEKGIDKIIEQRNFAEEKAKSDREAVIKGIAEINVEDVKAFFNLLKTKDFSEAGEKLKKFVLPITEGVSNDEIAARLLSLSGRLNAELDKATKNFKESYLKELDYKNVFSKALSREDFISATDKVFSSLQSYTDEYGVKKTIGPKPLKNTSPITIPTQI